MHKDKKAKITGTGGAGKAVVMGILDRERGKVREARRERSTRDATSGNLQACRRRVRSFHRCLGSLQRPRPRLRSRRDRPRRGVCQRPDSYQWDRELLVAPETWPQRHYVSVEPFHLFRYLDEHAFRYNNRKTNDAGRFIDVMNGVTGKRVTYKKLTGKEEVAETA